MGNPPGDNEEEDACAFVMRIACFRKTCSSLGVGQGTGSDITLTLGPGPPGKPGGPAAPRGPWVEGQYTQHQDMWNTWVRVQYLYNGRISPSDERKVTYSGAGGSNVAISTTSTSGTSRASTTSLSGQTARSLHRGQHQRGVVRTAQEAGRSFLEVYGDF